MIISMAPLRASGWGLDLAHWFIHPVPYVLIYRVSQKKWDLCLNAHNTPCKWTIDKSRVSFGKFRKFPFH